MCRNLILSVLVVCGLTTGASIANAELLITVNGLNPVDSPLTIEGTDQILLAVEGNSPTEPNNVSITTSGGTLKPVADVNQQYLLDVNDETTLAIVSMIANTDIIIEEKPVPEGATICELYFFFDGDNNIVSIIGLSINELLPPEEEEIEQSEFIVEDSAEQSDVSIEESPREVEAQPTTYYNPLPTIAIKQGKQKVLMNCPNSIVETAHIRPNKKENESIIMSDDSNGKSMLDSVIEVSSDITTNQIWTANNIYHIAADISIEALLVIEPGTIVKYAPDKSMMVINGGTLISCGTPDNPIIYTSDSTEPWYGDYYCAIFIDETASASTKVTYSYIEYAFYGIWVMNNRLDSLIENNYLYHNAYGILEYGTEHTDVYNNLIYASYYNSIEINMESYEGLGDADSHILIQNNTCDYYQNVGIAVFGVENEADAGEVTLTKNIVSGSYQCGVVLANGWMYFTVSNTGYYDNVADRFGYNESDEYNPIYETTSPYVDGTGTLPVCYLRSDSAFVNASDEYIEQTRLIGKTTDINEFPDSNLTDIGFHYPNWNFSNAGDGIMLSMDLNQDLIVNFEDFVLLAEGWQIAYDIYDLNTMADEWLNIANAHPPIAVTILGDSNNLSGKTDIGINGRSYNTTEGFICVDGELKGYIDYTEDPETVYEFASIDTQTLGNGQHDIKAVVIDTNGLITVSPTVSVDMNNALYYVTKANDFNEGEDYHLYAMSNSTNELRVKLVGWDGNNVWTSGNSVGDLKMSVPSSVLTGQIYNIIIEMNTGVLLNFESIYEDPIKNRRKIPGPYKVAIFLPNGRLGTGEPTADCRMAAVAELVRWCELKNMKYVILYKDECTWNNFVEVLSQPSVRYVYMVAHGYNLVNRKPNDPNPTHRLFFYVSGHSGGINDVERVFSYKDENLGDWYMNPRGHSMEELGLGWSTQIRCVYMTVCYMGESTEMARRWIMWDPVPLNQLFCGFEECHGNNSDWKDWDYQFWCRWGSGDILASDVIDDLFDVHPLIWFEFQPIGWTQILFTTSGN